MKPILFKEANVTFTPPEGYDPETAKVMIADLPALVQDGFITTVWKPSFEDLNRLNSGGAIALAIMGKRMPVVSVTAIQLDYVEVPNVEPTDD